jgi:hypothetical protein
MEIKCGQACFTEEIKFFRILAYNYYYLPNQGIPDFALYLLLLKLGRVTKFAIEAVLARVVEFKTIVLVIVSA